MNKVLLTCLVLATTGCAMTPAQQAAFSRFASDFSARQAETNKQTYNNLLNNMQQNSPETYTVIRNGRSSICTYWPATRTHTCN